jgi:hypothetical protein
MRFAPNRVRRMTSGAFFPSFLQQPQHEQMVSSLSRSNAFSWVAEALRGLVAVLAERDARIEAGGLRRLRGEPATPNSSKAEFFTVAVRW